MRRAGLTADEVIAGYKLASIRRVFPGQFLSSTIDIIEGEAAKGDRSARTALKLLFEKRFDK
jgi:hypothetical protein